MPRRKAHFLGRCESLACGAPPPPLQVLNEFRARSRFLSFTGPFFFSLTLTLSFRYPLLVLIYTSPIYFASNTSMERYQLLSELYQSGGVDALPVDLACWSQKDLNDTLEYAITDKLYSLVALLLDHGAQVTESVFRRACGSKDLVVFQCLLDHGWNINSTPFGEPALRYEALYPLI